MTPEAQRIAIAEACGWTIHVQNGIVFCWSEELNKTLPPEDDGMRQCPDYLNDLNAMHEAENTLSDNDAVVYAANLTRGHDIWDVMPKDEHFTCCYGALHATASQRAEAFLRTIGKWEDDIKA